MIKKVIIFFKLMQAIFANNNRIDLNRQFIYRDKYRGRSNNLTSLYVSVCYLPLVMNVFAYCPKI